MNKYIIKFGKTSKMRYISHLDLMRLFQRSLKRAGIRLVHSQGFNPHPKMSIAQPLSLGYGSTGEYLEFETTLPLTPMELQDRLNGKLPVGIEILRCGCFREGTKTLASVVTYARYEMTIPIYSEIAPDLVSKFLAQPEIIVSKVQRKSNKHLDIDIKPLIRSFTAKSSDGNLSLYMTICCGSVKNLNPEYLAKAFLDYIGCDNSLLEAAITRTDLYFLQDDLLLSLDSFII